MKNFCLECTLLLIDSFKFGFGGVQKSPFSSLVAFLETLEILENPRLWDTKEHPTIF